MNSNNEVYPAKKAQIAQFKMDKAFSKIFCEYTDFIDIFFPKLAIKLSKYMKFNNHTIKLVND